MKENYTATVKPALGYLGILGVLGFAGIPIYMKTGMTFAFLFFGFFGFFGFVFKGKMSHVLMDEMYLEHRMKANEKAVQLAGIMLCLFIVFVGATESHIEDKTILLILCEIFLGLLIEGFNLVQEYLTYKYDVVCEEEE